MRKKFNFLKYIDYYLIISGVAFLSSFLMFIIFTFDSEYPKDGWNFIGSHVDTKKSFLISSIDFFVITFIVFIISKTINTNKKIAIVRFNPGKIILIDDVFKFLLIFYLLSIYLARIYGVDILNRPELLSGFFRELIYYSYRTLIPFTIIFVYPLASVRVRRLIIFIVPLYCWLSDSRTPILLTSLLYIVDIYINEIGYKKLTKLIFILLYSFFLVFFFSNHRGLISQESHNKSSVQREYQAVQKNYEQTFVSQKSSIVLRDVITTPLSRISSHSDFLLIYSWNIELKQIGFLILNRFFGITTSKYNFSEEMKKLYEFDPGPGKMAAPGPVGIALALFKAGLLGKVCIILILSGILISINFVIDKLACYVHYPDVFLSLLKSLLYIQWLWISPRSAIIGLVYFAFLAMVFKFVTLFNGINPKFR